LTGLTASFGLDLVAARLGDEVETCRRVILFLGFEMGLCMMLAIYGGIIAGCHRWDIHNSITASNYAMATIGMLAVLPLGFGLPTLAAIHCFFSVSAEILRWRLARRVCPEFRINYRLASRSVWLEQFRFSVKNLIPRIADLISSQTFSLIIVSSFGPAMLAIYSRPKSLLRSLQGFAAKFGFILIPTASALQASSDHGALRRTLAQSTHFIACLAMPAILTLVIFGDRVIQLWMGNGYVYVGLASVLSVSSFFTIVQEPVWSILSGLNRHGRVGYFKLAGAIGSVAGLAVVLFWLKWGLVGVALAFAVPQLVVDSLVTPAYACRCLGLSLGSYYRGVLFKPLWWCSSYLGALLLARFALQFNLWLAGSLLLGGLLSLVWIYWLAMVPAALRQSILGRLPFVRTRIGSEVMAPAVTED
jgi:O-antigen/teichoic acid export membrane protein